MLSAKRVLDVLQFAPEPFPLPALPTFGDVVGFVFIGYAYATIVASLLGIHILQFMLGVIAISVIYSSPPLRLRRWFVSANLCIGLISGMVFLMGYMLVNGNTITYEPLAAAFGIAVGMFLISACKDIKDARADRQALRRL